MKKSKTGPIVSKGTKASEKSNDHARPTNKGNSKSIKRTWPPGEAAPISKKHKFVNYKSSYC